MSESNDKILEKLSSLINIFFLLLSAILVIGGLIGWFQLSSFKDSLRNDISKETKSVLPKIAELDEKKDSVDRLIGELNDLRNSTSEELSQLKSITERQRVESSPGVLLAKARNALDKDKDVVESTKYLTMLLDTSSSLPGEYIYAALFAKNNLSNKPLVRRLLDKALKISPDNTLAKAVRYEYIAYEKPREEAQKEIEDLLSKHGGDPSIVKAAANYYIELDDYQGLKDAMLIVANKYPTSAPAYRNLAVAAEELRLDSREIETYYDKALQYSRNDDSIHARYGHYLRSLGRFDEALEQYKLASEIDPTDDDYYYYMALIYFRKNEIDKSIQNVNLALELSPDLSQTNLRSSVLKRRIEMSSK